MAVGGFYKLEVADFMNKMERVDGQRSSAYHYLETHTTSSDYPHIKVY
jgi:hypothetical protein